MFVTLIAYPTGAKVRVVSIFLLQDAANASGRAVNQVPGCVCSKMLGVVPIDNE